jgi:NAD+ synthase (glutamine-hydrolysing)
VGGQDEVVFDGGSFAVAADGSSRARSPAFREDLFYVTADRTAPASSSPPR